MGHMLAVQMYGVPPDDGPPTNEMAIITDDHRFNMKAKQLRALTLPLPLCLRAFQLSEIILYKKLKCYTSS